MSLIDSIRKVRGTFKPAAPSVPTVELEGRRVLLVYLFPALGDAVLLAPAVKALLDGGAKSVGVLLRKNAARIFKLVDLSARIHICPEELVLPAGDRGWRDVAEDADALEKKLSKYDVAVDLTMKKNVDARRWLQQAEHRFGFLDPDETAEDAGLTWGALDTRVEGERHWSKYLVVPLEPLGIEKPVFDLSFSIGKKSKTAAEKVWSDSDGPRVVLVPGARSENKRFEADRFIEVGRHVVEKHGGSLVICGAPDENELIKPIIKAIGKSHATKYTKKSLETLLAVIDSANVVVTNDTGPMHFSFLLGKPTVAVFTYMSAVCWGPPRKDPKFITMNAPQDLVKDPHGVWTRTIIHYVDGLCARSS